VTGSIRVAITLEQCWHRVPGGTARAAVETAAVLAERPDLEVVGVSARHRGPADPPYRPSVPVEQHLLPRRALYDAWQFLRWPPVSRATGKVDVIHATGIVMPPPTAPIVWTLHDLAWRRDPSGFTRRGVRFFERALRLAREDARLVLCSSEATLEDAVEAGLPRDRLRLVPLGVRPRMVSGDEITTVRKARGLRRPYVLSVGTVEPRKNLPTLVEAFSDLARAGLDLVLVGPDGWHEDLQTVVEPLGERARPLGFVAEGELATLYAGASAFAYPSSWEGFGLPVLEAMAYGTPVVTSAGTACAEVTGDAALLVDPKDPAALQTALNRLIEDSELADRLRHDGRLRASHYTWERTAELTAAAYRDALG
jgi:glycosyltransferase involved in cell wall biosynthesis